MIRPATADRYEKAFQFFQFSSQKVDIGSQKVIVDSQLASYLENLWEEGESISLAGDSISAVQRFQPSMRKHLPQSWRLLKTWQQHELPPRAPPFTIQTLQVLLGWFHQQEPRVALALFYRFGVFFAQGKCCPLLPKISPSHSLLGRYQDLGLLYQVQNQVSEPYSLRRGGATDQWHLTKILAM